MNKLLLLLTLVSASLNLKAQNAALNCGNGRYTNDVFTDFTKTAGVTYGVNTTTDYSNGSTYNETLQFDFYEPTGDPAIIRPLIILLFGGGFINGQRSDLEPFCIALAKKGYAVATIDYRLAHNNFLNYLLVFSNTALLADVVVKASGDLKAAIRYFKHDAATSNTYRIDPTKIIVGGGSSGAIAAIEAAYTDDVNENPLTTTQYNNNGGIEGNTDLPAPNNLLPTYNSSGIAAVINIAGGVSDTSLIDANNPPIYSAQGSADEVIPYTFGQIAFGGLNSSTTIYGSSLIHMRANNIGLKSELFTIPGGDHQSPSIEPYVSQIVAGVSTFLESIVCQSVLPVTLTSFNVQSNNCVAMLQWKTATEKLSSQYEIESSVDGINYQKAGTIVSKNSPNGADYTYNLTGYNSPTFFRIKMKDKDGAYTYSSVQVFSPACVAHIQVYPNPATTQVKLRGLEAGMQVNVISVEGRLLWAQRARGNIMEIPLNKIASGVLLVQVRDKAGRIVTTSKLIKQ